MPLPAANLDAMLKATGQPVVFDGVVSDPEPYGRLRVEEVIDTDPSGRELVLKRTTLLIRDGVQPVTWKADALLTVGGVSYRLRDPGFVQPDGLRKAILVPVRA